MKNKIILLTIMLGLFASCEDLLDKQPLDRISEATFWLSPKDADAGLQACYDVLQSSRNGMNATYEMWGMMDALTPISYSRQNAYNTIAEGTHDPNNRIVSSYWNWGYKGIARCNDVLDHIDDIPYPENELNIKERVKGEASFLRALYYYKLVMAFGDVPLILSIQEVSESLIPRASQADVIAAMHGDLDVAINSLPVSYSGADVGRATKGAALTLKTKTHLLEKDWSGAASSAKQVIDLGVYSLQPTLKDVFNWQNENNSEVIFDIQFISYVGDGATFDKMYATRSHSSWGWSWLSPTLWLVDKFEKIEDDPEYVIEDDRIQPEVYEYFEGRDPRMDATILRPGGHTIVEKGLDKLYPYGITNFHHSKTGLTIKKTIIEGDGGIAYDSPNNWVLFRYADVLLMYAEAKKELGQLDQATADLTINAIRARASDKLPLYNAGDITIENIYDECIRELAFEGWLFPRFKRWNMLKLNSGFEVMGMATNASSCAFASSPVVTRQYFDYHQWWPIPQQELDINTNLTQNPGYSE